MIKYVGFDKDGTLLDSVPVYLKAWGEIFHREYGIDKSEASNYLFKTMGQPAFDQTDAILRNHNIILSKEEVFNKSIQIETELGKIKIKAFPDVSSALGKLKTQGCLTFVSSAFEETVIKSNLESAGISEYFDLILGVRPGQPDFKKGLPHFKAASEFFHDPFEEFTKSSVFVGDTQTDIQIANEAEIISVGRVGIYSKEELINCGARFAVDDFSSLPDLISRI